MVNFTSPGRSHTVILCLTNTKPRWKAETIIGSSAVMILMMQLKQELASQGDGETGSDGCYPGTSLVSVLCFWCCHDVHKSKGPEQERAMARRRASPAVHTCLWVLTLTPSSPVTEKRWNTCIRDQTVCSGIHLALKYLPPTGCATAVLVKHTAAN